MKTLTDPRHLKRRKAIQELFALSFHSPTDNQPTSGPLVYQVKSKLEVIDKIIRKSAPAFPVDKINRVDLAILRLAVFELLNQTTPPKVIIDEAVELAKEFGGENSFSFVNGVLGTILKKL